MQSWPSDVNVCLSGRVASRRRAWSEDVAALTPGFDGRLSRSVASQLQVAVRALWPRVDVSAAGRGKHLRTGFKEAWRRILDESEPDRVGIGRVEVQHLKTAADGAANNRNAKVHGPTEPQRQLTFVGAFGLPPLPRAGRLFGAVREDGNDGQAAGNVLARKGQRGGNSGLGIGHVVPFKNDKGL